MSFLRKGALVCLLIAVLAAVEAEQHFSYRRLRAVEDVTESEDHLAQDESSLDIQSYEPDPLGGDHDNDKNKKAEEEIGANQETGAVKIKKGSKKENEKVTDSKKEKKKKGKRTTPEDESIIEPTTSETTASTNETTASTNETSVSTNRTKTRKVEHFIPSHIRIQIIQNFTQAVEGDEKQIIISLSLHDEDDHISTPYPHVNTSMAMSRSHDNVAEPIPTTPPEPVIPYMEVTDGGFLNVTSNDEFRMTISNGSFWVTSAQIANGVNFTLNLTAHYVGYANLTFVWHTGTQNDTHQHEITLIRHLELHSIQIAVLRPAAVVDDVFFYTLTVMVMFNVFMMGTLLDLKILLAVLKKPLGPIVGFFSQFLFMPLGSWVIGWLLFNEMDLRLGLFCLGCCPGGSQSNLWTLLFNGDMNLSMTMTFISSIAAVAMMPLWLYTLGKTLTSSTLTVPFVQLIVSLILFTVPVVVGILVTLKLPAVTKKLEALVKPITILSLVVMYTLGMYANRYIFHLLTWQIVLAGVGVAGGGYAFGALMAWIFRLGKPQIIAVSIETAFQNAGISFLILKLSLSQPGGDLAGVPSISQLLVTSIPLYIFLAGYLGVKKCKERKKLQQKGVVEKSEYPDQNLPMMENFDMSGYQGNIYHGPLPVYDRNGTTSHPINQYATYDNGYRKVGTFPVNSSPHVAQRLSNI